MQDSTGAEPVGEPQRSNVIQVSCNKKPLSFYVNLAKRYLQLHGDVELSGLGMAITNLVNVAEILKRNKFAVEKKIITSIVDVEDEFREGTTQKSRISITLTKSSKFDELMGSVVTDDENDDDDYGDDDDDDDTVFHEEVD